MKALKQHIKDNFNIEFNDERILIEAFTHASYANDHRHLVSEPIKNLERLEFLGDAVIELFVSDYLFNQFKELPEGQLTRLRASIVRAESLAELATECQLAQFIRLGKGEEKMGGRQRPALLCDVFEAFVGAIYQDQGVESVRRFLRQVMFSKVEQNSFSYDTDYKTALQEFMQQSGVVNIEYTVLETSGPDHDREFTVEVSIEGDYHGVGMGKSKKLAEQKAAKQALEALSS
ncbi:ribonuclease III [Dolosigranulum pigrum]